MKRIFASLVALAIAAPAAAAPLDQVRQHLRAVRTMTADFVQTDGKGRSVSGTIQLERPGKVRFQYQKGVPLLVVGDGRSLTMIDYKVRQVSRWPIGRTPLALLLDPERDVSTVAKEVSSADPNMLLIGNADGKRRDYGSIVVAFRRVAGAPGGLALEGWTVTDAQNARTTVRLSNTRFNVAVPDNAFRWTDPRAQGRR